MARKRNRRADALRPVRIERGFTEFAPGSVLIRCGRTRVLCTASVEEKVPPWLAGRGRGWVTAEYAMLPSSTPTRKPRGRGKVDGRAAEIQRMIGRSLRTVTDLAALGERQISVDCDVLQADGGTRTAAVTGAWVALADCLRRLRAEGTLDASPLTDQVAAVSVGVVEGKAVLDLDYALDVSAAVDLNVAMTAGGEYVEVQGAAEGAPFSGEMLGRMLALAAKGCRALHRLQKAALQERPRSGKRTGRKS